MNLENLKSQIKDYAKDVRLNLDSVLSEEGAPGLSEMQITALALASAYAICSKTTKLRRLSFQKCPRDYV